MRLYFFGFRILYIFVHVDLMHYFYLPHSISWLDALYHLAFPVLVHFLWAFQLLLVIMIGLW